jgi:hypothetical protein
MKTIELAMSKDNLRDAVANWLYASKLILPGESIVDVTFPKEVAKLKVRIAKEGEEVEFLKF